MGSLDTKCVFEVTQQLILSAEIIKENGFTAYHKRYVRIVLLGTPIVRVPTRPGKPGKMRVHLENLEISWNFEKINKYHGKIT